MTVALGLLDPRIPAPLPGSKPVSLLDPDLAAAINAGNESRALESREQNEEEIAALLRETLKTIYGDSIEEPKEPADVTKKKYVKEFSSFALFCLSQHALPEIEAPRSLPTRPELVAAYLHHLIQSGARSPKLRCVSAAISRAHRLKAYGDPTDDPLVAGILKVSRERQKASPIRKKKIKTLNGHSKGI